MRSKPTGRRLAAPLVSSSNSKHRPKSHLTIIPEGHDKRYWLCHVLIYTSPAQSCGAGTEEKGEIDSGFLAGWIHRIYLGTMTSTGTTCVREERSTRRTTGPCNPEDTTNAPVCIARKDTLEFHLRPYRVPMDTLWVKHSAVVGMVTRLLGVTPRCDQYLELWPEGFETYNVMVPNLFDIPFCDFGMGTLTPHMRSIPAYVASRTYGCAYCSSHTAVMGTVWGGSGLTLDKNAQAMDAEPNVEIFTSKELAAINIAKKVGAVPATVTTEDIRQLAMELSEKEQEAVVNATSIMGFLNRFMDASGMTLEMEAIETSLSKLAPSGWKAGVSYDAQADQELMEEDKVEAKKREQRNQSAGFFSFVSMLFGAKWADTKALGKVPSSDYAIYERCKDETGFVPFYIRKIQHGAAKRAFTYGYLLRLNQGSTEVSAALKQTMCYQCALNGGNKILAAHFAFLAHRNGVSIDRLAQIADESSTGGGASAAEDAAMALAQACSWTPARMTPTLVGLITRLFSPPAVIELLITLSVYLALHRWTSVYVPKRYEPEIGKFVDMHGERLHMNKRPCTAEQAGWEDIAIHTRRGVIHE